MRVEPPRSTGSSLVCRLISLFIVAAAAIVRSDAQIVLNVQQGASPNEVVLTWSGGTAAYNLYMGGSGDLSGGGVEVLLSNTSNTSYTATISGDLVFFRVGDSAAPQPTITSPSSPVVGDHVTVSGNTSAPAAAVWVNRRPSSLVGTSFSASDVLLVLGNNALHATAVSSDGNISIASSQVTRNPGNDLPLISIVSPSDGAEVTDVTPLVQLSYSDSPALDPANLHVYLDGTDQTSNFTPTATATSASWQIPGANALVLGDHVLRATIKDSAGFTSSASAQFRVAGPRLDFLSPSRGVPNNTVTIAGAGFGTTSDTLVFFNGIQATNILSMTQTQIQVRVPTGATDGPLTVEVNSIASNPLPFDVTLLTAGGSSFFIAVDTQDRVYYSDQTLTQIFRVNQDGTGLTTFFSSSDEIDGFAFDPAGTTLYVNTRGAPVYHGTQFDYSTGRIYSVDLNGNATLRFVLDPFTAPRFSDPSGIDVKPPFVYVGAYEADSAQVVLQLDLNNPGSRTVLLVFPLSNWLFGDVKVDSVGNIYTTYSVSGASASPAIYKNSSFFYQIGLPQAMTIDCLDRVLFTDPANGQVLRLVGSQSAVVLSTTGGGGPYGIDIDSKGNLFVATDSVVRRATGNNATISSCSADFAVSLSGDPAKIYADYDPSSGTETPNSQFVVLTACLEDSSVPRASSDRVYWTWEDVDDPATDPTIDPNGAQVCGPGVPCDNLGDPDGSLEFTQEDTFTLTVGAPGPLQFGTAYGTVGSSICSKVRFHFTDAPGDNFTVTAILRTKLGDRSVTSHVMTVWKRVHVELDSMGEVEGVIDPDDAVIGDVPDPTPDFLASAFAPAYIEIFNDGPGPRTNVTFDPHVPDLFTSENDPALTPQVDNQGTLGRDLFSSSGAWKLYGQGAYEGPVNKDRDPDTEEAYLGITNRASGKYSLVFAEAIRDYAEASASFDEAYFKRAIALHELAHQFGVLDDKVNSDGSGGIMEYKSFFGYPYFNPAQLRIIRTNAQSNGFPSQLE